MSPGEVAKPLGEIAMLNRTPLSNAPQDQTATAAHLRSLTKISLAALAFGLAQPALAQDQTEDTGTQMKPR